MQRAVPEPAWVLYDEIFDHEDCIKSIVEKAESSVFSLFFLRFLEKVKYSVVYLRLKVMGHMLIRRADTFPLKCGAWSVRVTAMARKHGIPLEKEFDAHDMDNEKTKFLIALDGNVPVGTGRFYPLDETAVMLGRIVVLPDYRHQGIGTQLVLACEKWAKELGFSVSHLEARENKTAFYEAIGYTVCGGPVVSGDTFVCIPMEKKLV